MANRACGVAFCSDRTQYGSIATLSMIFARPTPQHMDDLRWPLVESYFRSVSLTQQTLHSFDDFMHRVAPEIIESYSVLKVHGKKRTDIKHTFRFSNFECKRPVVSERDGDICFITPEDARTRSLTYQAPIYVNLHHTGPDGSTRLRCFLGNMPIMIRSTRCNTNFIANHGECPNDPGDISS